MEAPFASWERLEPAMRAVIKRLKEFPSRDRLREVDASLANAAQEYHGGYRAVRARLGYDGIQHPAGYWKVWERLEPEIEAAIERNRGRFPSRDWLRHERMGHVVHGITDYHGGFDAVRTHMGYPRSLGGGMIRTAERFATFVSALPDAGYAVQRLSSDEEIAAVIAVMYPTRLTEDGVRLFLADGIMRERIGAGKRPLADVSELREAGERLLRYDRDATIRGILFIKELNRRRPGLGEEPPQGAVQGLIADIEQELGLA